MRQHNRRGFTLIELLVVIAIIAILAAILFPVFARARMKAHAATCVSNLKQIAMSIRMYCDDYEGYGPYTSCGSFWEDKLYRGGYGPKRESALYRCKGGNGNLTLNYYRGGHCACGPGGSTVPWQIDSQVRSPEAVMLVADARGAIPTAFPNYFYDIPGDGSMTPAHVGVNNLAFVDGHVKGVTPNWLKETENTEPWYWWSLP